LIVDECAQALEIATWIRIVKCKKALLVGDDMQLTPVAKNKSMSDNENFTSLFKRLKTVIPQEFISTLCI